MALPTCPHCEIKLSSNEFAGGRCPMCKGTFRGTTRRAVEPASPSGNGGSKRHSVARRPDTKKAKMSSSQMVGTMIGAGVAAVLYTPVMKATASFGLAATYGAAFAVGFAIIFAGSCIGKLAGTPAGR